MLDGPEVSICCDPGDSTPVLGCVLGHAVAGSIQRCNEEPLVRVVGMDQDRHPLSRQGLLSLGVTVLIVAIGRIDVDAVGSAVQLAHVCVPCSICAAENLDQVVTKINLLVTWRSEEGRVGKEGVMRWISRGGACL